MTDPKDAVLLITFAARPNGFEAAAGLCRDQPANVVTLCGRNYTLEAQRFSSVVLPCHVSSFGLGPSHTATGARSACCGYLCRRGRQIGLQRSDIIEAIHEELQDTD